MHLLDHLFSAPWETKLSYSVVCPKSTETWIGPYGSRGWGTVLKMHDYDMCNMKTFCMAINKLRGSESDI